MEVDPKLKSAVENLKSGNTESFNEIYQKTYNYVYFRARQIMKNEDDAMDLMQIVYMEAYKSIKSLDKPESVYSWLSSITFRQGMKIFQKKKEILLDEDFENIFDSMETSDSDARPELALERKEQQRLVAELIDSLPEVQRATMVAFYYDNIKIEEIAEVMDCSVGTVKSRLSYARQALKKKLEAEEKKSGKTGLGKMVLSGALIFGAVQIMSEETVLAAPVAAGVFSNICSGLGIAATGAAVAGSALAGGAGISAATGTAAATTTAAASGAAIAGSTAAATTVGTAAAGTVAGTAAAGAGTAAAGAGTAAGAAAGTAAAGAGAAKGLAVAVAVAVAGTGGTVGTTIYRNTVSQMDKVSSNEEAATPVSENIPDRDITEVPEEISEEPVSDAVEVADEVTEASTEASGESSAEDTVSDGNISSEDEKKAAPEKEEADDDTVNEYGMSGKLEKHLAKAVASLFMAGGGNLYNGEVSNDNLEAAYILENGLFKSKKEIKALSGNAIFLTRPDISSSVKEGDMITVKGSFDVGNLDEGGSVSYNRYDFILHGDKLKEKGVYGSFNARDLSITHDPDAVKVEEKKDKDKNKAVSSNGDGIQNTGNGEKNGSDQSEGMKPEDKALNPENEFMDPELLNMLETVTGATVSEGAS